jgi:catechol 2,3-dioxygenase-like lactoylglutathione lyase family enzyme
MPSTTNHASSLIYVAPVLRVANLARSLAHYRETLGFELEFVHGDFYASVMREGCRLHLKAAPPLPRAQEPGEPGDHIDACFGVRDARALAITFAARGAAFALQPHRQAYGSGFYLCDPDGCILGFVEAA